MAPDVHPNELADIATILARGYLRHRESMRRASQNCLASAAEGSPHVPVVHETENGRETEKTTGEEA